MLGGALVRRAVVAIAAVLLFAGTAGAQSEADVMVEKFAREAQRSEAKREAERKAEAGRAKRESEQKADEAKAKKDADRKAAQAGRALEIRKQAEAQRLKAELRHQAEAMQAAEEAEMLVRARQEADEAKATAEIRRLIEQAEAERLRVEALIAQQEGPAPVKAEVKTAGPTTDTAQAKDATDAGKLEVAAPQEQVRIPMYPGVAGMARRVRHVQQARRMAAARQQADQAEAERVRVAEQAEAERVRVAERARDLQRRIADRGVLVRRLTRVQHWREARTLAEALHAAQSAEAERVRQAEAARAEQARQTQSAQAVYRRLAERQRLGHGLGRLRHVRAARLAAQARTIAVAGSQVPTTDKAPHLALGTASGPQIAAAPLPKVLPTPVPSTPPGDQIPPASAPFPGRSALGADPDGRVTVLLIMVPGTYGVRRGATVADPVLCAIDGCYVSGGTDAPARFLRGRKALGVGNTLGGRAGACRHSLGCVFRAIDLPLPGAIQPVDLHILKHDRKRPQVVTSDSDCRLAGGRLSCNRAFRAEDYTLWILPEWLAASAGPEALDRAVREGLAPARSADASPPH